VTRKKVIEAAIRCTSPGPNECSECPFWSDHKTGCAELFAKFINDTPAPEDLGPWMHDAAAILATCPPTTEGIPSSVRKLAIALRDAGKAGA